MIAVSITAGASYAVTGSFEVMAALVSVDFILKTIGYYIHELLWEKNTTGPGGGEGLITERSMKRSRH